MFFPRPKTHVCVACGKPIEPKAKRFVEKNRITKVERHTHIDCRANSFATDTRTN